MIKANDLRIGNLVLFEDEIFQIHILTPYDVFLNTDRFGPGVVTYDNIQPIPLQTDLLVNWLGFEEEKYKHLYKIFKSGSFTYFFDLYLYEAGVFYYTKSAHGSILQKIRSLHHLQNIFYFTTEVELTGKLIDLHSK